MGFFEEDPFENIVKEFFGSSANGSASNRGRIISGEEEDRNIDYIETLDKIFLVFELPGYNKEDVNLEIKSGKLNISVSRKNLDGLAPYLANKLSRDLKISKPLPPNFKSKKYEFTFRNGVLEVEFKK